MKFAYHAPSVKESDFFPMLVLDAVLTGAKGLNLVVELPRGAASEIATVYGTG